jgi:hypothetical protein
MGRPAGCPAALRGSPPLASMDSRVKGVVVAAARFGLVNGHPLAVGQVAHLVGHGELADPRTAERLGLPRAGAVPRAAARAGQTRGCRKQFRDQRADVRVAGCAGASERRRAAVVSAHVPSRRTVAWPPGRRTCTGSCSAARAASPPGRPTGDGIGAGGQQVAGAGEHPRRAGPTDSRSWQTPGRTTRLDRVVRARGGTQTTPDLRGSRAALPLPGSRAERKPLCARPPRIGCFSVTLLCPQWRLTRAAAHAGIQPSASSAFRRTAKPAQLPGKFRPRPG